MELIDKDAVVEEIKRLQCFFVNERDGFEKGYHHILRLFKSFINTLEVKKDLTWQDIKLISEIGESFMNSDESDNLSEEEYYTEILRRFKNDTRR